RVLSTSLLLSSPLPCFLPLLLRRPPSSPLFPYTTLFRSAHDPRAVRRVALDRQPLLVRQARVGEQDVVREGELADVVQQAGGVQDRKSTRLNSSHQIISYAVVCLKKKKIKTA